MFGTTGFAAPMQTYGAPMMQTVGAPMMQAPMMQTVAAPMQTCAAPVATTYAAAPMVETIAAPMMQTYAAPQMIETFAAPVMQQQAPVTTSVVQGAPVVIGTQQMQMQQIIAEAAPAVYIQAPAPVVETREIVREVVVPQSRQLRKSYKFRKCSSKSRCGKCL